VPQVSVIIPTYNCARYLPEAIDSVLAQTYRDFEIIVVDDGSTDDTPDVLARYGEAILVIRQPNQGRGAARNAGILAARGQYIAFLDADDLWLPRKLEKQMALFEERSEIGWVYSDYRYFGDTSTGDDSFFGRHSLRPPPEGWILVKLLAGCITSTITVMARAACFRQVGLFDPSLVRAQDYDMWIRLACRSEVGCVDNVLALYRQHPGQDSGLDARIASLYYTWRLLRNFVRDRCPDLPHELRREAARTARQRVVGCACGLGHAALEIGDRRLARRWFLTAAQSTLGDWASRAQLLPWCVGQLLDTVLPQRVMDAARRAKRTIARAAAKARARASLGHTRSVNGRGREPA